MTAPLFSVRSQRPAKSRVFLVTCHPERSEGSEIYLRPQPAEGLERRSRQSSPPPGVAAGCAAEGCNLNLDRLRPGQANLFARLLALHSLRQTSCRLDRLRLGKTQTPFVFALALHYLCPCGRKTSKMKKFRWILLLILLVAAAAFLYFRFWFVFGEGVKTGELNYEIGRASCRERVSFAV